MATEFRKKALPYTGLLVQALLDTAKLYEKTFQLITPEEKEVYKSIGVYAEALKISQQQSDQRVFELHTSLLQSVFEPHIYECLLGYRLKVRLAELQLTDIMLGQNRGKKTEYYLPLGPLYRWADKLRAKAKEEKKFKTEEGLPEPAYVLKHKIILYVQQHIKHTFSPDDKKSLQLSDDILNWRETVRINLIEPDEDQSSKGRFRAAMDKVRDLLDDETIEDLFEMMGFEADAEEIKKVKERLLGDENGEGGLGADDLFEQLSSGELDREGIRKLTQKTKTMFEETEPQEIEEKEEYEETERLEAISESEEEYESGAESSETA